MEPGLTRAPGDLVIHWVLCYSHACCYLVVLLYLLFSGVWWYCGTVVLWYCGAPRLRWYSSGVLIGLMVVWLGTIVSPIVQVVLYSTEH